MKKAGLLLLLFSSVTAQAAIIQYDIRYEMEPDGWSTGDPPGGILEGSLFVDSSAGTLTGIDATFTRYWGTTPDFAVNWSGSAPLTVYWDDLGPGNHSVLLMEPISLNGDRLHLAWESVRPGTGNVFESLHTSDEGYGTYERAGGGHFLIATKSGTTFVSRTVPEPGSWALLGLGLAALGFRRRIS